MATTLTTKQQQPLNKTKNNSNRRVIIKRVDPAYARKRKALGIDEMESNMKRGDNEQRFWRDLKHFIGVYGTDAMISAIQNPEYIETYINAVETAKGLTNDMLTKAKEQL